MIETMSQKVKSLKKEQHFDHIPIKLEWQITILRGGGSQCIRKRFMVAGYHLEFAFQLFYFGNFQIIIHPLTEWYYDKLKWPFKAEFITHLNYQLNTKEFKVIVVEKKLFNSNFHGEIIIARDSEDPLWRRHYIYDLTDINIYVILL